jgi:hypothetical protein
VKVRPPPLCTVSRMLVYFSACLAYDSSLLFSFTNAEAALNASLAVAALSNSLSRLVSLSFSWSLRTCFSFNWFLMSVITFTVVSPCSNYSLYSPFVFV